MTEVRFLSEALFAERPEAWLAQKNRHEKHGKNQIFLVFFVSSVARVFAGYPRRYRLTISGIGMGLTLGHRQAGVGDDAVKITADLTGIGIANYVASSGAQVPACNQHGDRWGKTAHGDILVDHHPI